MPTLKSTLSTPHSQVPRNLVVRLHAFPTLPDMHDALLKAMNSRGSVVELIWQQGSNQPYYFLEITCAEGPSEPLWRLYSGPTQRERNLAWQHQSCDVLLILNLLLSSSGNVAQTIQAEGIMYNTETFRDQTKGSYFIRSLDSAGVESTQNAPRQMPAAPKSAPSTLPVQPAAPSNVFVGAPSGDLSSTDLSSVIQSLTISQLTGMLMISNMRGAAKVAFNAGTAVYATTPKNTGDRAILELVLEWNQGRFQFLPNQNALCENIKHPVAELVALAGKVRVKLNELIKMGWKPTSILHKTLCRDSQLTDAKLRDWESIDLQLRQQFFAAIDGSSTTKQITDKLDLTSDQWIPLLSALVSGGMVAFSIDQTPATRPVVAPIAAANFMPPVKAIDTTVITNVAHGLKAPSTGIYTHPSLLYFMEQEYFRAHRSRSSMSIVTFEMRCKPSVPGGQDEVLPLPALWAAVMRINQLKRQVDIFAHYEADDFALLLPDTGCAGARIIGSRIIEALLSSPLAPGIDESKLHLAFGIATYPDNCQNMATLLAAADMARTQAGSSATRLVEYCQIQRVS